MYGIASCGSSDTGQDEATHRNQVLMAEFDRTMRHVLACNRGADRLLTDAKVSLLLCFSLFQCARL